MAFTINKGWFIEVMKYNKMYGGPADCFGFVWFFFIVTITLDSLWNALSQGLLVESGSNTQKNSWQQGQGIIQGDKESQRLKL